MDKYANLCIIICSREITKNELRNACTRTYTPDMRIGIAGTASSGTATATGTGVGGWRRQVALCERSKLFVLQLFVAKV